MAQRLSGRKSTRGGTPLPFYYAQPSCDTETVANQDEGRASLVLLRNERFYYQGSDRQQSVDAQVQVPYLQVEVRSI